MIESFYGGGFSYDGGKPRKRYTGAFGNNTEGNRGKNNGRADGKADGRKDGRTDGLPCLCCFAVVFCVNAWLVV